MAKIAAVVDRLNVLFDADPRNDTSIGDALGVSKQTVSAWRKGQRSPKKSIVTKIAEYYNVDEAWIYGYDLPTPSFLTEKAKEAPIPPEENERIAMITSLLNDLPEDRQEEVLRYVQFLASSETQADK